MQRVVEATQSRFARPAIDGRRTARFVLPL